VADRGALRALRRDRGCRLHADTAGERARAGARLGWPAPAEPTDGGARIAGHRARARARQDGRHRGRMLVKQWKYLSDIWGVPSGIVSVVTCTSPGSFRSDAARSCL